MVVCSTYSQKYRAVDLEIAWSSDYRELRSSATNNDYCDYYIAVYLDDLSGFELFFSPHTSTLSRGINNLFSLKREGNVSPHYSCTYSYYRGNVNQKVNPDYLYALPVKSGDSIQIRPKENSSYTLLFDLTHTSSDTVYACRGGIVCDDDLYDVSDREHNRKYSQLTIYHADGSFGKYTYWDTSLVSPGQKVEVGTPIALVVNKDRRLNERFSFAVYFLNKNALKNLQCNVYAHLVPRFHTADTGNVKLETNKTYIANVTDELIMQDMNKKEKANYLKKRNKQ